MLEIYNFHPDELMREICILDQQLYSLISDETQISKDN
jgi:hypothetical protein